MENKLQKYIDSARFMTSSDTMIKNVKHVELNISIVTVFWNTQILKMI